MNNQRPGPVNGMLRQYFLDGFLIMERRENGEWVEVLRVPEDKVIDDE